MQNSLSHSKLYLYRQCPLKYRFTYIDRIRPAFIPSALAFGTSIHKALAFFYRSAMEGKRTKREELLREFEESWAEAQRRDEIHYEDGEDFEQLLQMGRRILDVFAVKARPQKILSVEERFEVELENPETGEILDLPLRGIIDLVEQDEKGRTVVVCNKTARKEYSKLQIGQNLQLPIYALAASKLGLCESEKVLLRVDVLLKTEKSDLVSYYALRGKEDFRKLYLIVKEIWRSIKEEIFYPNYGYQCDGCPFLENCQEW